MSQLAFKIEIYQIIESLKNANNIAQLNQYLDVQLALMGIHAFSYSHYSYHPRAKQKLKYEYCSKNFLPWHEYYLSEQHEEIDSTLHACYLSTEPFIWMLDEQLAQAKTPKERQMRIDSINFGIQGGISIPIHGPNNDFAHLVLIQMNNDDFLQHAQQLMPVLLLLGNYYYSAILRLLPTQHTSTQQTLLTTRELACLTMVAQHISVEEIAKKLSITTRTTHFHIQNANKKLGVANKFDAVNKAIELGLIVL